MVGGTDTSTSIVDVTENETNEGNKKDVNTNPDHLTGPDKPYTGLDNSKVMMKSNGTAFRNAVEGVPEWVKTTIRPNEDLKTPGSVKVYPVQFKEDSTYANRWNARMLVAARDSIKTSKIVLVIDRSGSMRDENRLVKAKEAAKA